MSDFLILLVVVVAVLWAFVVIRGSGVMAEIRYVRRDLREIEHRIRARTSSASNRVKELVSEVKNQHAWFASIRELKDYGAQGVRWSALENAGITTIAKIPNKERLEAISGVGPTTASKVDAARRAHLRDYPFPFRVVEEAEGYESTLKALALLASYQKESARLESLQSAVNKKLGGYSAMTLGLSSQSALEKAYEDVAAFAKQAKTETEEIAANLSRIEAGKSLETPTRDLIIATLRSSGLNVMRELEAGSDAAPGTEKHFEDERVEPWLRSVNVRFTRQHKVRLKVGSNRTNAYIDFALLDHDGQIVSLIESKREINTDTQLQETILQARSYALHLKIKRFLVAAPQGLWVVEWSIDGEKILLRVDPKDIHRESTKILELVGVPSGG